MANAGGGAATSPPTFEIGLALAGAISAGAYTAGVIDFLTEALDAYEEMKSGKGWTGPTHAVKLSVIAGASAGGMTGAIAALQLHHELEHAKEKQAPPAKPLNRLYSSWVTDIGIDGLLDTTDLRALETAPAGAALKSGLCCDVLDRIVGDAFGLGPAKPRPWLGSRHGAGLTLFLTLTNVRGVPYAFRLRAGRGAAGSYGMLDHGDRLRFDVGGPPAAPPTGGVRIDPANTATTPDAVWRVFRAAALGTGAFPIGLAPRIVDRTIASYGLDAKYHDPIGTAISPDFPPNQTNTRFPVLDGGMIDNEPLETARRFLSGDPTGKSRNPRDGLEADRAVVLVDPFPNGDARIDVGASPEVSFGMVATLKTIFGLLVDQARFKPEELQLVDDSSIFSRFAITPSRGDDPNRLQIACGALGGFSGFLEPSWRRHDYMLGRRNAQAFLRWVFVLPVGNTVVGNAVPEPWLVRARPGDPSENGFLLVSARADEKPSHRAVPIVPLSKDLAAEIVVDGDDLPATPSPDAAVAALADRLHARIDGVVGRLLDVELRPLLEGWKGWQPVRWVARSVIVGLVERKAKAMLTEAYRRVATDFTPPAG